MIYESTLLALMICLVGALFDPLSCIDNYFMPDQESDANTWAW